MATNLHQVKRGYADLKRSGTQMYYERMGHGDPVIWQNPLCVYKRSFRYTD